MKSARLRAVTKKLTVRTAHIDLTGIKEQSPVQRPQPLSVWEDWAAFSEQQYAALVRVHSNTRRLMLHQKRIRATVVLQSFARMWLVRAPMVNKIDTPAKRAQLLRFNSSLTDLYKKESQYASALENVIGVRVSICASRLYATLDRKSLIDIDCSLSLLHSQSR